LDAFLFMEREEVPYGSSIGIRYRMTYNHSGQ
jgi:hypothetical protein